MSLGTPICDSGLQRGVIGPEAASTDMPGLIGLTKSDRVSLFCS